VAYPEETNSNVGPRLPARSFTVGLRRDSPPRRSAYRQRALPVIGRSGQSVDRLVLNGSFVTDVLEPNDVDCVLLIGAGFPRDAAAEAELLAGLPFLELSLVTQDFVDLLVDEFFAADRQSIGKGPGGGDSMSLQSHREFETTRDKLRLLEQRYEAARRKGGGDEHARELSMRSLRRLINQLKEEIARFESRISTRTGGK